MSYSGEKNSKYFDYSTCLFGLSRPCQKKSEIRQPPLPPLTETIISWQTPPPSLVRKNQKLPDSSPHLVADIICEPPLSLNNIFFCVCKSKSCKIMVCHDPNCGNIYFECSKVCEVASGLLTPRGRHN